jgi:carnosine N-methyltransferase
MSGLVECVECWDCIVTCFFIDAAPNVIEYIAAFERMLKPGGYWINLGPLLYHWQNGSSEEDVRFDQSVELTYEEIKHVMGTYNFKILVRRPCSHGSYQRLSVSFPLCSEQKEAQRECVYTNNVKSMMKTVYNCAFFTAIKDVTRS